MFEANAKYKVTLFCKCCFKKKDRYKNGLFEFVYILAWDKHPSLKMASTRKIISPYF